MSAVAGSRTIVQHTAIFTGTYKTDFYDYLPRQLCWIWTRVCKPGHLALALSCKWPSLMEPEKVRGLYIYGPCYLWNKNYVKSEMLIFLFRWQAESAFPSLKWSVLDAIMALLPTIQMRFFQLWQELKLSANIYSKSSSKMSAAVEIFGTLSGCCFLSCFFSTLLINWSKPRQSGYVRFWDSISEKIRSQPNWANFRSISVGFRIDSWEYLNFEALNSFRTLPRWVNFGEIR